MKRLHEVDRSTARRGAWVSPWVSVAGHSGSGSPTQRPLLASSVLSAKYRRKCASGSGDPRTYRSPENEIASPSLLCDACTRATTDDQLGDVGPYVFKAVGGP